MKYLKPKMILLLISLTFYSCDPHGVYNYEIENNSEQDIIAYYKQRGDSDRRTILIKSKSIARIDSFRTTNGLYDYKENLITEFFDTLIIVPGNNLKLTKDLYNRINWDYQAVPTGRMFLVRSGKNNYRFVVKKEDFKPIQSQ